MAGRPDRRRKPEFRAGCTARATRRIDRQRRAYHHEDIGFGGKRRSAHELGNRFAEKDDMRAQQRAVGSHVVETLLDAVERHDERRIVRRAQFGEFAVEVEDMCRTGTFVQVVDILGDDLNIEIAFQSGNGRCAGLGSAESISRRRSL